MHGYVITYSDLFDQKMPDLDQVVSRIPSKIAIQYFSFLSCQLHYNPSDQKLQEELIGGLIRRQPDLVRYSIWNRYKKLNQRSSTILIDIYTAMELLNRVLMNYNAREEKDTSPNDEMNILMSILIVNQKYNQVYKPVEVKRTLDLYASLAWPFLIFSSELRLKKYHIHEAYRGIEFSAFLEGNKEFKDIFNELHQTDDDPLFLYPGSILKMYTLDGYNKKTRTFNNMFPIGIEKEYPYVQPWILDLANYNFSDYVSLDYRTLRSFPIIKVYDDCYCVSNWNFVLDKSYTGLLFDLYEKTEIKLPDSSKDKPEYKNFQAFKGVFGEAFSEQFSIRLFRDALPNYKVKSGDPSRNDNQDIYIRQGRKIALIENKDLLFVKDTDYEKIKRTLDKKLVKENGVKQLIKLITKLKENPAFIEEHLNQEVNSNKLVVYPIIVVSDSTFILTGMEDYVNDCFKEQLKEFGKLPFYVHRIVIMDLYSLMNIHDPLVLGKIDFFDYLDTFFQQKIRLKRYSWKHSKDIFDVSEVFKGFSELKGYNHGPSISSEKKQKKGTLKYKMFKLLKSLGATG
jgi:hypothetical protein